MKEKLFVACFVIFTGLFLVSCGGSHGFIRDSVTNHQVQYQLNYKNVKFLRTVEGTASTGSVFCAIPIDDKLYARAINDMYRNAAGELQNNQMVINLREDRTVRSYLGFFCKVNLTVSGDLVEFN